MTTTASRRRPTRALVVAAALTLALLAAACGSDTSSSTTTTGSDTTADASGSTSDTFRIGLQGPLTGSLADLGQGMLRGAEMAAETLNADGGIDGRQVEIVPIDDAGDPDTGEAAATEAIDAGLDAVAGPYNSGVGSVTLPLYIDAGLVPMRLTSADSTAGLGFTLQPMTSQIAPAAVTAITTWAEADRVALIVDSTEEYTQDAAAAMEELLPEAGVTITGVEEIQPGADSYTDAVEAALATDPELVYVVTYSPEAGAIAQDMAAADRSDIRCLIDYGGYDDGFVAAAGDAGARCSLVGVPAPDDFPDSASLVAAFEDTFDAEPGAWTPYTHDSVLLLADAIERAGSTDPEALTEALATTSGWTGWTGTVSFDADTGDREPAPVTVDTLGDDGHLHVDDTWAAAVGFTY
ncbi:branched-chain amino acid ABC transporter substrate-binding protein [Rhabdothermincola salaria]|uniref:branched-chain amino acid ABC transporter substrate-binding protein n=1 Tax=Rhabdothermincola salaria TaxID=2903142 RepID=UPI001E450FCF|nr:branched-chain amino acid ABC transporter substrate-binding protein [Rhabdothermincola salaria]MCD9622784.1 branched-chain amino acid ABC transporter substrate-binding protein [Rhabdothermincola salaria]